MATKYVHEVSAPLIRRLQAALASRCPMGYRGLSFLVSIGIHWKYLKSSNSRAIFGTLAGRTPYPHIGQHFLTWFTLISGMTNFGSKLAKISQLAAQNVPSKNCGGKAISSQLFKKWLNQQNNSCLDLCIFQSCAKSYVEVKCRKSIKPIGKVNFR